MSGGESEETESVGKQNNPSYIEGSVAWDLEDDSEACSAEDVAATSSLIQNQSRLPSLASAAFFYAASSSVNS